MQVALVRKEPTLERKAARMAALLRSAQFIGRYTSDLAGREARQQELTKHWCVADDFCALTADGSRKYLL